MTTAGAASLLTGCLTCPNKIETETETHPVDPPPAGWIIVPDGTALQDPSGNLYGPDSTNVLPCATFCDSDADDCGLQRCASPDGEGGYDEGSPESAECEGTSARFVVQCTSTVSNPDSCGRRPPGLAARRKGAHEDPMAAYFAGAAHLEAASVDAFELLGAELAAHGAPRSLLRCAARSAQDERRHARAMASLARRAGARVHKPRVHRPRSLRPVLAIALENAREGNVYETYGALVALWQAERAEDPRLRATFAMIARDEARHAALSWRVAGWAEKQLSPQERATVTRARAQAAEELRAGLLGEPAGELSRRAGVPTATVAAALFSELSRRLLDPEQSTR